MARSNAKYLEKASLESLRQLISIFIIQKNDDTHKYRKANLAKEAGIANVILTKIMNPYYQLIPTIDTLRSLGNVMGERLYSCMIVYAGYGEEKCDILPDDDENIALPSVFTNALIKYPLHPASDNTSVTYVNSDITAKLLYCLAQKNISGWKVVDINPSATSDLTISYAPRVPALPITSWIFIYEKCDGKFDILQYLPHILSAREHIGSDIKVSLVLDGIDPKEAKEISSIPIFDFYFSIITIKGNNVSEYHIKTTDQHDYSKIIDNKLTI